MPSKTTHRKGHTKDKDENDTYKKFSCQSRPKHRECKGQWNSTRKTGHKGETQWMVKWAPCRKDEAVQFVKEKYGHKYNPDPPNGNDPRHEKRHRKKTVAHMGTLSYFAVNVDPEYRPREMPTGKHHTRAQAADRHHNEHDRRQPRRMSSLEGARLLHDFKEATRTSMPQNQARDPMVAAWVGEQGVPEAAIPPSQDTKPRGHHHKRRHHRSGHERRPEQGPPPPAAVLANAYMPPEVPQQQFTTAPKHMSTTNRGKMHAWMDDRPDWNVDDSNSDEDIAPPSCFAGGQTIFSNPAMPLRQRTTVGQQQTYNQDESESESDSESGQIPQPQSMPVGIVSHMNPAVPPVMPPAEDALGGQEQMRHHGMPQYGQMPPSEAFAMAPAAHTAPAVPSAQGAHGGQYQRHSRRQSVVSYHEQTPPPLEAQPPPRTMRECMASMAEEAKLANPTQSIALRPGPPPPPGMAMPPGCTQYLDLRAEVQEASRMPGPRDMKFPMGPPQAGTMPIAAAGAFDMPAPPMNATMPEAPHNQSTRRAPRQGQQPPPPGMSSRASVAAASAAGTPGPQAMAMRPGAVSGPPAMSSNLRRQPPPTSMPPFPGTGPGTPGSMDIARAPPPPVPTPPPPLGEDD